MFFNHWILVYLPMHTRHIVGLCPRCPDDCSQKKERKSFPVEMQTENRSRKKEVLNYDNRISWTKQFSLMVWWVNGLYPHPRPLHTKPQLRCCESIHPGPPFWPFFPSILVFRFAIMFSSHPFRFFFDEINESIDTFSWSTFTRICFA